MNNYSLCVKIISLLKKCVLGLLVQMVMNKIVIMLPLSSSFVPFEAFLLLDFLLVFCKIPFSHSVGTWLLDGSGVDVSWSLDCDVLMFEPVI